MTRTRISSRILSEFKAWRKQPPIQKDCGIIWVLSGQDTGWEKGSDTRRRLEEGMRLAKKVARMNRGKLPAVYISGWDEHNTNLKKWRAEGLFEKIYGFPRRKMLIGPQERIIHTGDQFRLFPKKFLRGNKKIIVLTDLYHLPRARRHMARYFPLQRDRFIFYPAAPVSISSAEVARQTRKIIEYAKRGFIPLFPDVKKVVVSGASGFLGSRLIAELSKRDDASSVPLPREAFRNQKLLRSKVRGADVVFHLAGVNRANSPEEYQFNMSSTKMLLAAMKSVAPSALLVYTSSFAVYRPPRKGQTVDERFPLQPRNAYGASKLAAEKLLRTALQRYGISSLALRISNMYGPHAKTSRAIVDQIRHAIETGKPITVHTDMSATRDFVYVDDVVSALIRVMGRRSKRKRYEVFKICTGDEVSIAAIIQMAEKVAGKKLDIVKRPDANERAAYWQGSFQKAKKGLQWQPKVKIHQGLRKTLV